MSVREEVLRKERVCVSPVGRFVQLDGTWMPSYEETVVGQYGSVEERWAMIRDLDLDIVAVVE